MPGHISAWKWSSMTPESLRSFGKSSNAHLSASAMFSTPSAQMSMDSERSRPNNAAWKVANSPSRLKATRLIVRAVREPGIRVVDHSAPSLAKIDERRRDVRFGTSKRVIRSCTVVVVKDKMNTLRKQRSITEEQRVAPLWGALVHSLHSLMSKTSSVGVCLRRLSMLEGSTSSSPDRYKCVSCGSG